MKQTVRESARKTDLLDPYDVVVAGGGFAGFGAACAAARDGARTLLIERLEMLGGLGAVGMVGNFSYGHHYVKAQGKVFDDIIAGLSQLRAIGEENGYIRRTSMVRNVKVYREDGSGQFDVRDREPIFFNVTFNAAMLPIMLQHIALASGVDILYATDVVGAVPALIGFKVGGREEDWYTAMQPIFDRLSVFVPGHLLASGRARGAHGAYSNVACLQPAGVQRWFRKMETDPAGAQDLERRFVAFFAEHLLPLRKERDYTNQALDKLLAAIGGWADVGTRLRWPYNWFPTETAKRLRPVARELLPEMWT